MTVEWQHYPKSKDAPSLLKNVIRCFERIDSEIDSQSHELHSNEVLERLRRHLEEIGFDVEKGRRGDQRIRVPVLFGLDGKPEKSFEVDAYREDFGVVLEIEAGRAVANYQFLKDFFEACIMYNVTYLVLGIRRVYKRSKDFEKVVTFFDTLYASGRMSIPLKGILIIGY